MKRIDFTNQSIGLELEGTGITRELAAQTIAEFFGGTVHRTYDYYDTYEITEPENNRKWKVMSDASLQTKKKVNGEYIAADKTYSVEVVSPILAYSDIPAYQEMVRKLRKAGFVSRSEFGAGLHIHIGLGNHTAKTLRTLMNITASKEDLILKALAVDPNRMRYCQKIDRTFLKQLNEKKPETMEELADIWYAQAPGEDRNRHYNNSRYRALNYHSVFTKGSIEWRLANGTTHCGQIRAFVCLCLAMSHQALTQKCASPKATVTTNDKYSFRCWLLRLGFIGDELKNCRMHLLNNLDGDSAFRNGVRPAA